MKFYPQLIFKRRIMLRLATPCVCLIAIGLLVLSNTSGLTAVFTRQAHAADPSTGPTVDQLKREHPRVMLTRTDVERIKNSINTDQTLKQWYDKLIGDANLILTERTAWYDIPDGVRLLEMSRTVLRRMYALGMAYQLTGDQKYVDRAWADLESASGLNPNINFPDWHTSHFLDTAEMTNAFAIGYDWMYDAWTPQQRDAIRNAIVTRGLNEGLRVYRGDHSGNSNRWFWVNNPNNWNIVCNSGLAIGALAVGEESTDISNEILQSSYNNIPQGLGGIHADGSYSESIGYWGYATAYATYYLTSLLSATGSDYGLIAATPGLAKTGDFPLALNGPKLSFNYGDTGNGRIGGSQLYWLASYFHKPEYAAYQKSLGLGDAKSMIWYDPSQQASLEDLPLDSYFNVANVTTMRNSWSNPGALFVGLKAGGNQDGHNDLDLGTFVLDAQNTRWAEELGQGDYNSLGYWEEGANGRRWNYYRKRAEGQNTLVINPGTQPDQDPLAQTQVTAFASNATEAFSVVDLTAAYAKDATSVKRGIRLLDQRRQVLVQDEIQNKAPADVWWFMHTRATIAVSSDGKSALLSLNKKRLWARLITPGAGTFTVMDAVPLPTSPQVTNQANPGVRKLTVHLPNTTQTTIGIQLVPLLDGENPPTRPCDHITPLSSWKLSQNEYPKLGSIQVNGQPLNGFRADRFSYNIALPVDAQQAPVITAKTADGKQVRVTQTTGLPGTARICLRGVICYTVSYRSALWTGPLTDAPKLTVAAVTASANDGNIPENTLDGNLSTRWSADGDGQWIRYDLGTEQTIGLLGIAFFNGNQRFTTFDIEVSNDATTWQQVFRGASSSETTAEEIFDFSDTSARYVRIVGHGNSANTFNSITEVSIYGPRG